MPSIDRREFLLLCAATAAEFATACTPPGINTSAKPKERKPIDPIEAWRTIPPGDRLRRLEKKQFPQISGFPVIPEVSLAAAQLRCQITTCNRSIDDMQQAVKVLSPDDFSKAYERVHGYKLEQDPIKGELVIEFVEGKPLHTINLNTDAIRLAVSKISPQNRAAYQGNRIDPEISLIKQTIIHAQSHMNQTQEKLSLAQPLKVQLPYSPEYITVLGMDGLFLNALDPNNNPIVISGISETLTEVTTDFICAKAGAYALLDPGGYGVDLINPLFNLAGIRTEDALAVYHGRRKQTELINWLGSIQKGPKASEKNISAQEIGGKVLTIIGLTVNLVISVPTARIWLEQMYGRRLYVRP